MTSWWIQGVVLLKLNEIFRFELQHKTNCNDNFEIFLKLYCEIKLQGYLRLPNLLLCKHATKLTHRLLYSIWRYAHKLTRKMGSYNLSVV